MDNHCVMCGAYLADTSRMVCEKCEKGEPKMENKKPCLNCTRVEDPSDCEIKTCSVWKKWWLKRWERVRKELQASREQEAESD